MCRTGRMHCHHITLRSQGVDHQEHNLIMLCNECHDRVHRDTRWWQPILRAYVWLRTVENKSLTLPEVERLLGWPRLIGSRRVENDCWIWTGSLTKEGGYGRMSLNGEVQCTHRIAYVNTNGPIPAGMKVLHHCDTPACFRPDHLFLGTQADNVADMKAKGRERKARGPDHPQNRLTEDQVREIRRRRLAGEKSIDLANEFGISYGMVGHIASGRAWAWLS